MLFFLGSLSYAFSFFILRHLCEDLTFCIVHTLEWIDFFVWSWRIGIESINSEFILIASSLVLKSSSVYPFSWCIPRLYINVEQVKRKVIQSKEICSKYVSVSVCLFLFVMFFDMDFMVIFFLTDISKSKSFKFGFPIIIQHSPFLSGENTLFH